MLKLFIPILIILFSVGLVDSVHAQEDSELPDWVRNIFVWYAEEEISESELLKAIEYLITEKIIDVSSKPDITKQSILDDSVLLGPTPYLSFEDSPFYDFGKDNPNFYLLDFEDQVINTPGVKALNGMPIHYKTFSSPNNVDSVDFDDGYLDGVGRGGSYYNVGQPVVEFEFQQDTLGNLPTHVGLVMTDGTDNVTIEAFGSKGLPLDKKIDSMKIGDTSYAGETNEDVFFGFIAKDGIKKIKISMIGHWEMDHLQYGR